MTRDDPNEPLDYRAPSQQPPISTLQLLAGCFAAAATIGIAAFLAGFLSFGIGYGDEGQPAVAMIVLAAIMCVAIGVIVMGALRARRHPQRRGMQIGLWLGLGVGLLIAGLCFTGM